MGSTSRTLVVVTAAAVAVALNAATLAAQGRGKGHGGPPTAKPAQAHVPKPAQVPKPAHVAKPAHVPKPVAVAKPVHVPKPAHVAKPAPVPKLAHAAKPPRPATVVRPAAFAPALIVRLTPLLPPNTSLTAASAGFKNRGQFIAAVNVSHNLGIPFDALKARMTGPNPMSLGQAIQDLRPAARADFEVRRAEAVARDWVRHR
jgi:outer membrane biosynthesis protein TonB